MKHAAAIIVPFILSLASCASTWSSQPVGPTNAETARNRARPYADGMAALDRYRASKECESPDSAVVLAKIEELEGSVSAFHSTGFAQYEAEARTQHTSLAFAFADEALKRDCLDASDKVYRRLVEYYVGNAYSGIRDRARLGVDDVRARRGRVGGVASSH